MYRTIGMPYRPSTTRPTNHQRDTPTVSTPVRHTAPRAWRQEASRSTQTAKTTHRIGPMPTSTTDVRFVLLMVRATRAKAAG